MSRERDCEQQLQDRMTLQDEQDHMSSYQIMCEDLQELATTSGIMLSTWQSSIDKTKWNSPVDISSGQAYDHRHLTTYFVQSLVKYISLSMTGDEVRLAFKEDFQGWTSYQFDQVNRSFRRRLLQQMKTQETQATERLVNLLQDRNNKPIVA